MEPLNPRPNGWQQQRPELLEETLQLNERVTKTNKHLGWGVVNATAVAALLYNLLNTTINDDNYLLYQAQRIIIVFLIINALLHFIMYSFNKITMKPVCMSPRQRALFGVKQNDRLFRNHPSSPPFMPAAKPESTFSATFPMNFSTTSCLFSSSQINDSGVSPSRAAQPETSIWTELRDISGLLPDEPIVDERSLSRYLEAVEEKVAAAHSVDATPTAMGSFWSSTSPRASPTADVSPLLRRSAYQMSSLSPVTPISSPGAHHAEDSHSPVTVSHAEFWRRCKIDPQQLTQWNANLRMWISLTILQRVVSELDHIDAAFVRCGFSDLHLGSVGLDRLKRTACLPQVASSIPSLPRLVPFLELTQHQEYLVSRIRELAKGGSMSEFRWNSGGSLHGKAWEEHLPTDSSLVIHLITTYLDLQLMSPSQRADQPSARPFSSQNFVRSPERPPQNPHSLTIYQASLNPPQFMLIDKDEVYDIPQGRNNVFHTFLLFLHLLKTREHGMIGPLNLGRSGVNVLWVVDS